MSLPNVNPSNWNDVVKAGAVQFGIGEQPDLDPDVYRKPEYFVHVYSVVDPRPGGQKIIRELPPLVKRLEIAEVKPGERYAKVISLPHPVNQPDFDVVNGKRITHFHNAKKVAMDIVNPANTTLNQDAQINNEFSENNNYGRLGVFWSLNDPPTEEEINKAIARKESFYRARLQQARALETSDPKALNSYLTTTDHVAADYFGEQFSWHRLPQKADKCPNCGESINRGVAFHRTMDGITCVIDWKRTVQAGVKSKEEVPPGMEWWEEKPSQGKRGAREAS